MASFVHPGASEAYDRPDDYDRRYAARTADVAHYVRLSRRAGRVLEYGAGSGRVTLPMARAGARVVAVELSRPMLRALEAKLAAEPPAVRARVTARPGDMRTLSLRGKFPLVVLAGDTFAHLYGRADVEAFLAKAMAHLEPGGALVFDLDMPRLPKAGGSESPEGLALDYDVMAQVLSSWDGEGRLLARRLFFPRELEMLLVENSFSNVRVRSAFGRDEGSLLVSCRKSDAPRALAGGRRRC